MSYQFDIEKVQDYFELLCALHIDILHSSTNRGFARFQSGEHISEIKKSACKNIVVVADINGQRVGHKDARMFSREVVLRFASYAEKNLEVIAAKNAAIQKAEEIMFDFMTKMEKQQEDDLDNEDCGIMHFLRPENISWEPIADEPWLLNHYGWDLTIPFHVYMPAYDGDKWNE